MWVAVQEQRKQGWMGPRENAERSFNTKPEEIYGKDAMMGLEPLQFTLSGHHMKNFPLFDINFQIVSWIHFMGRSVKKDTERTKSLPRPPQFNKKHNNSEIIKRTA